MGAVARAGTHLTHGKLASLASVGVRIVGRCKELCQRLKVHLSSFCIADGEYRVNAPCRELTLQVARPRRGRAGYDKTGIEERVEQSMNEG
jgi:hypothetical protein